MLETDIKTNLTNQGANFVHFVDISRLNEEQTRGYRSAIIFGISLSPEFIQKVTNTPDYVEELKASRNFNEDDFATKEAKTDRMADELADYLNQLGHESFSQSEKSLETANLYNPKQKRSPLPHKTIARMAGLGWIGKHNLLVTREYGSALSMCTVLTNAPLNSTIAERVVSKCGHCFACVCSCEPEALSGEAWQPGKDRDVLLNVHSCTTCLKCMMICPWTQKYSKSLQPAEQGNLNQLG